MFERFTDRARQVIVLAQGEARTLKHSHIGTEHLLLGLLREEEGMAARALNGLDVTTEGTRGALIQMIGIGEEALTGQIPFTPRATKVIELALREALGLGHNYIGTETARWLLHEMGCRRRDEVESGEVYDVLLKALDVTTEAA
jgi:ATP-dependent Clp protease ATP-binding subunit ClpC